MDPTISPSCATWLSMSCERTTPSLPCVESSSSQAGMTNTWPSLSLNFEMRLPWAGTCDRRYQQLSFNSPAQLVFDMGANDVVERRLSAKAQRRCAARVEILRPAGDDFCDYLIRLAADAPGDISSGDTC